MSARRGPTRRAVLLGALAVVATACRPRRSTRVAAAPRDLAALRSAVAAEESLLATYDAVIGAVPRAQRPLLRSQRRTHQLHLDALRALLPPATTATPEAAPAAEGSDTAALRQTLTGSGSTLTAAAVTAVDGTAAATLASVGAVHLSQGGGQ